MIITNIVYPIESGFLWLLRQDGFWGGWRDGPFMVHGGVLVPVINLKISCGKEMREHHVFLCDVHTMGKGERWRPILEGPEVEHFDLWGIPTEHLSPFERKFLPMFLKIGLPKLDRPLIFAE